MILEICGTYKYNIMCMNVKKGTNLHKKIDKIDP